MGSRGHGQLLTVTLPAAALLATSLLAVYLITRRKRKSPKVDDFRPSTIISDKWETASSASLISSSSSASSSSSSSPADVKLVELDQSLDEPASTSLPSAHPVSRVADVDSHIQETTIDQLCDDLPTKKDMHVMAATDSSSVTNDQSDVVMLKMAADLPSSFDDSSNDSACDLSTQFDKKVVLNGPTSTDNNNADMKVVMDTVKITEDVSDIPSGNGGDVVSSNKGTSSAHDYNQPNNQHQPSDDMKVKSHHNSGDSGNAVSPDHGQPHPAPPSRSRNNKHHNQRNHIIESPISTTFMSGNDSSGIASSNGSSPCDMAYLYGTMPSIMSPTIAATSSSSSSGSSPSHVYYSNHVSAIDVFEFELLSDYAGRLIGKAGIVIKDIQKNSGAKVVIANHAFLKNMSICSVSGDRSSIDLALRQIRSVFPFDQFPDITMAQVNVWPPSAPTTVMLPLTVTDVIMSSMVSAGHFFLQQPFQPTYSSLSILTEDMTKSYADNVPPLIALPAVGMIVAAPVMGGWYRAVIVDAPRQDPAVEVVVKFVDYGGYLKIKVSSLRQIRMDYMELPFQACECFLSDVGPAQGNQWSPEAGAFFESLAQGQGLKAVVTAVTLEGSYLVRLYRIELVTEQGQQEAASNPSTRISHPVDDSSTTASGDERCDVTPSYRTVFINEELVRAGHAKWLEPLVTPLGPIDSSNSCSSSSTD